MHLMRPVLFILILGQAWAATYNVATEAEFDSAVTAVNAGAGADTIVIAAGDIAFTTSKTFTKGVTILGAGMDVTRIIGDSGAVAMVSLAITGSSWVKDFTMINNSTTGSASCLTILGRGQMVSGMRFVGGRNKVLGLRLRTNSGQPIPTGVSWDCRFEGARAGDFQGDSVGNAPWFDSTITLGSQNAWYTENAFVDKVWNDGQNMFDHAAGGASVTRYSVIVDSSVFGHGHDADDNTNRSTRMMEVYGNQFRQIKYATEQPIRCNGGIVIAYENTLTGSYTPSNSFDLRMVAARMVGKTGSDWPLIDQPGRSTDVSLWSSAGSPPASQASVPVYEWNNTRNGADIDFVVPAGDSQTFIVEGRDYFNDTVMPGYSPLIWPHPLRPVVPIAANARYSRGRR